MAKLTLEETIVKIGPLDAVAMDAARARQDMLTKPAGALGKLEDISIQLAGIYGEAIPRPESKVVVVAAGDHGVVAEGVAAYPQEVTAQMVLNFIGGGAAINVLSRYAGARVVVVNAGIATDLPPNPKIVSLAIGKGTANMAKGPAMSLEQARQCLEEGIAIATSEIEKGADFVAAGEMGIGNTTAASAVTSVIAKRSPLEVTGLGTGITEDQRNHKAKVIEQAVALNKPDPNDGLDVLSKVGGFEIGVMAGVMLGAAASRRPVLMDGFISGSAALIAYTLCPIIRDYFVASHFSVEPGHSAVFDHLGMKPILDLGMRLGEGTGAALAMMIVDAAARCLAEMATFAEAAVSEKSE